ncbi:hypothetical protein LTR66_014626 [Elasticomyces elasticus]|nr:hypothetical protein LTR66_014626 [Elasticomyces elasticus]
MSRHQNHQNNSFASRTNVPTFGKFGNTLLERSNPGLRRSTPDSEVLASSDEEVEQSRLRATTSRHHLPTHRRSSLLADQIPTDSRRGLVNHLSQNKVNKPSRITPTNPPVESWSKMSPPTGWDSNRSNLESIWSSETAPFDDPSEQIRNALQSPPSARPTPTAIRSMSFSVGQTDNEFAAQTIPSTVMRSTLQRRTSTMAGESSLRRVNESEEEVSNQVVAQSQPFTNRSLMRAPSTNTQPHAANLQSSLRQLVYDSRDTAIEDMDDFNTASCSGLSRRMSELPTTQFARQQTLPAAQSSIATGRNALHWSTGLGFDTQDTSASRRHSFADVPTRRGSVGSNASNNDFSGQIPAGVPAPPGFAGFVPELPFNAVHYSAASPRPLHIVTFKCDRAAVFYVPDHVPITVNEGDLVVVEADRGFDVGTVHETNLTFQVADQLRDRYNAQQFEYLMMFSRHAQAAGPENYSNTTTMATFRNTGTLPGGAVKDGDTKPKQIYQHANHEHYHQLQTKEGEEAKAKRLCASKATHHGLHHMEILDAEFQADYKKLTFYYYSTTYVNFNILVTELFKHFKTRIWMSAINPASFQSPSSSIMPAATTASLSVNHARQAQIAPTPTRNPHNPALPYDPRNPYGTGQSAIPATTQSAYASEQVTSMTHAQQFFPTQDEVGFSNTSVGRNRLGNGYDFSQTNYPQNDTRGPQGRGASGSSAPSRHNNFNDQGYGRYVANTQAQLQARPYMTNAGQVPGMSFAPSGLAIPDSPENQSDFVTSFRGLNMNQRGRGNQGRGPGTGATGNQN